MDSTGDSDVRLNNLSKKYDLSTDLIKELFVQTEKQKFKLLVDEAVYTKNRHFRLFGSSKQRKKVPLVTSKSNEYVPVQSGDSTPNLCIFLDSLVTYFSWEVTRVLEFQNDKYGKRKSDGRGKVERTEKSETMAAESLIHPQVDIFIRNLISPNGRIRRKTFFSDSSTILYEITGFRYCDNIKREHKSNNIKYVVDLQVLGFYQKCYDPDCVDFRSAIIPLPDEIRFLYEEDSVFDGVTDITEIEDFWEEDEDFLRVVQVDTGSTSQLIDDGADDELSNVLDCTEAMLDMTW
ncbi:hypothetical protein RUM43_000215 [Polyplax serrata]|uniref:DNA-directed primase/polymerase protein n=1 Tax=Polyplax serrata TaxID=468196 RepID=A0AAN8SC60_POLSC